MPLLLLFDCSECYFMFCLVLFVACSEYHEMTSTSGLTPAWFDAHVVYFVSYSLMCILVSNVSRLDKIPFARTCVLLRFSYSLVTVRCSRLVAPCMSGTASFRFLPRGCLCGRRRSFADSLLLRLQLHRFSRRVVGLPFAQHLYFFWGSAMEIV